MKKDEFLRELEISLTGKLPDTDINEILTDYNDIFEDGILENRDEDEISESIGSPAAISKAIIDDSSNDTLQKKSAQITSDIRDLAPMSKRFLAYLLDTALIFVPLALLIILINTSAPQASSSYEAGTVISTEVYRVSSKASPKTFIFSAIRLLNSLMLLMGLGLVNIITAFELWLFKGYTFGKWITKIKVVSLDGNKITFWDAFLRDTIIKFVGALLTSGILNGFSFIWGCTTTEHKTIHDLAAKTKVINIKR